MNYLTSRKRLWLFLIAAFGSLPGFAANADTANWLNSTGVIGTSVLVVLVLAISLIIGLVKFNDFIKKMKKKRLARDREQFNEDIISLESDEIDRILEQRKEALNYKLSGEELGSGNKAVDRKGLIYKLEHDPEPSFYDRKKKT